MPIAINNIPAESVALGDVEGRQFSATIYRLPSGRIAAAVLLAPGASVSDLASEKMNSRIHSEAMRLTGSAPAFYQIDRLLPED